MPKKPKILLGVVHPSHFYFPSEHVRSLLHAISWAYYNDAVEKIDMFFAASPSTATNRNDVLDKVRDQDFVCMIDCDMTFTPDIFYHLVGTAQNNPGCVVTGLGCIGQPPFLPAVFKWNEESRHHDHIQVWPEDKLFRVDAVGSYCLFIPTEVIKKLPKHPFDHIYDFFPEKEKQGEREMRHDMAFSKRCRDNDIKIICNPAIKLGHLRPYPNSPDDYALNRDFLKPKTGKE